MRCARELKTINGDIKSIKEDLNKLCRENRPFLVDVIVESDLITPLVQAGFREQVEDTQVDIVKIRRKFSVNARKSTLIRISIYQISMRWRYFHVVLDDEEIPEEERKDLIDAYCEILASVCEDDIQAR